MGPYGLSPYGLGKTGSFCLYGEGTYSLGRMGALSLHGLRPYGVGPLAEAPVAWISLVSVPLSLARIAYFLHILMACVMVSVHVSLCCLVPYGVSPYGLNSYGPLGLQPHGIFQFWNR